MLRGLVVGLVADSGCHLVAERGKVPGRGLGPVDELNQRRRGGFDERLDDLPPPHPAGSFMVDRNGHEGRGLPESPECRGSVNDKDPLQPGAVRRLQEMQEGYAGPRVHVA